MTISRYRKELNSYKRAATRTTSTVRNLRLSDSFVPAISKAVIIPLLKLLSILNCVLVMLNWE